MSWLKMIWYRFQYNVIMARKKRGIARRRARLGMS